MKLRVWIWTALFLKCSWNDSVLCSVTYRDLGCLLWRRRMLSKYTLRSLEAIWSFRGKRTSAFLLLSCYLHFRKYFPKTDHQSTFLVFLKHRSLVARTQSSAYPNFLDITLAGIHYLICWIYIPQNYTKCSVTQYVIYKMSQTPTRNHLMEFCWLHLLSILCRTQPFKSYLRWR